MSPAEGQVFPKHTQAWGCLKAGTGNVGILKNSHSVPPKAHGPQPTPPSFPRLRKRPQSTLTYPWGDQELPKYLKTQRIFEILKDFC